MKVLILVCLVVVVVSAYQVEELGAEFQAFKVKFDKTYKDYAEEAKRISIFINNLRSIEEHNALYEQGLSTYKKGINQFTDMTQEEFKAFLKYSSRNKPQINGTKFVKTKVAIPDSVDWRTQGQVTEVKNQDACGSCWAFSVTGSTEAAYYRKSNNLVSFSEQQLVDCSKDANIGCDGGVIVANYPYLQEYGIESEESYPYLAADGDCKYDASAVVTKIDGYVAFDALDEESLLNAVATIGPVSVAIDASPIGGYASGIYTGDDCASEADQLNHGVLIVGYGTENGTPYWIVKNSWSPNFGEQGYFRILRGSNKCGIAQDMSYPFIN